MKSTPGPWKVNYKDGVIQVGPSGEKDLAWVTNETDARLIAAAPDLLELCKKAKKALSMVEWSCDDTVKQLHEAIAKAEGDNHDDPGKD